MNRSNKIFLGFLFFFLLVAMTIGAYATARDHYRADVCMGLAPPTGADTFCTDVIMWPGTTDLMVGDLLPAEMIYEHPPVWLARSMMSSVVVTINGRKVETQLLDNDIAVTFP